MERADNIRLQPSGPSIARLAALEAPVDDLGQLLRLIHARQAARRLREEDSYDPIIALTAHAPAHQIELFLASGCDAHVAKPIGWLLLVETIRCQLDRRGKLAAFSAGSDSPVSPQQRSIGASPPRPAQQPSPQKRGSKPAGKPARRSRRSGNRGWPAVRSDPIDRVLARWSL